MSGGNRHYEYEDVLEFSKELEGKLVIAEGKKDSRALKTLGVKNIILLNGRPLAELALHVSKSIATSDNEESREGVVILTDFDSKGKELAARLDYLLKKHKVMVNSRIRRKFMKFGKTRIEDLKEGDIHGKVSANINKVRDNRAHKGQRRG
jgi:5S rRNA maturation endonuclease (ribonuclease M5)